MVCVLAKNDPLAALDVISPIEISHLPLISFSRQTVLGRQIEAAFAKHGFDRRIDIEVRYCETACALAQKGAGIPIVDQFVLMGEAAFSDLAVRAFEPKIETEMCLVHSKLRRLSRVSQRFVRVLASEIERKRTRIPPPRTELSAVRRSGGLSLATETTPPRHRRAPPRAGASGTPASLFAPTRA
jgi:DNA-binding transcriptional LysR family regulator